METDTTETQSTGFSIDQWKKIYCNNPLQVSLDEIVKTPDISFWIANYKSEDLPGMDFMIKNYVNGLFGSVDDIEENEKNVHARHNSFARAFITESPTGYNLAIFWILNKLEVPNYFNGTDVFEYFNWTRLEPTDKRIEKYLSKDDNAIIITYK